MKQEQEVHISVIFLWVAMAIMVALLAWWAFGSSPTKEDLAVGITIFGTVLTWASMHTFTTAIKSLHDDHTQILKTIQERVK